MSPRPTRVQRTFLDLMKLPPRDRRREAARRLRGDPAALREVLRLLPHAKPPSRFLRPPTGVDTTSPRFSEPDATPGRVLGGRYRIVRELGRGGGGIVAEAFDEVAKERVAVKVMRGIGEGDLRRVRREVATVRWLALPGVVRFRDDGIDGEDAWCVTDLVEGRPFPGAGRRGRWSRIEPVALGLLETMARVHWAGVIHRDLKPHNVLVDAGGRATVLDLGLAAPRDEGLLGGGNDVTGGTPGYAAPEQIDGRRSDARTDVYALGVMLFEALTGRLPKGRASCAGLRAPPRVRRAIARMIAPDPDRRPATIAEALALLRPARRGARRRRPWTRAELKAMFAGFDRIHHLPTDAAAEMFRRTAGDPRAVEEEIASWVRAGLARPEGEQYYVDRVALERLRRIPPSAAAANFRLAATPAERRLMRALRGGDPAEVYRAAIAAGKEARRDGRPLRAGTAFSEAVQAARAAHRSSWEVHALRRQLDAAFASSGRRDVEEARFAISQSTADPVRLRHLADIASAGLAVLSGRNANADALARRAAGEGDRTSQWIAWSIRAAIAQQSGPAAESRFLVAARRWARGAASPAARLSLLHWTANSLCTRGRFSEATRAALRTARALRKRPWVLAEALVTAASMAIEGREFALAAKLAARGRSIAARRRLARVEGFAEVVLRKSMYRAGALAPSDPELLDILSGLGTVTLLGIARITEAAFAWRAARPTLAASIASARLPKDDPSRLSVADLFLYAIAASSGRSGGPREALAVAKAAALRCPPAVATQVLALLTLGHPKLRPQFARLAPRIPEGQTDQQMAARREVLSLAECRSILMRDGNFRFPAPG